MIKIKKIFYEIEVKILEKIKNDESYEEKFLKELVDFRSYQLKIDFIKIFKYKMITKSIIAPFSESDLMKLVENLKKIIFDLNEKQIRKLKILEKKFPKEYEEMNLAILQQNFQNFLNILESR